MKKVIFSFLVLLASNLASAQQKADLSGYPSNVQEGSARVEVYQDQFAITISGDAAKPIIDGLVNIAGSQRDNGHGQVVKTKRASNIMCSEVYNDGKLYDRYCSTIVGNDGKMRSLD